MSQVTAKRATLHTSLQEPLVKFRADYLTYSFFLETLNAY